ncbi:hypothetical protein BsWGS_25081 [Bradybaena similaris]
MALPGGIHLIYPIGLLCLSVGLFMQLIGLASSSWSLKDGDPILYYGLWDLCTGEVCAEHKEEFVNGSIKACQAFAIMGMVVGGVALILGVTFILMTILKKSPHRFIPLAAMICGSVSFVFIDIGVVTWAGGMPIRSEVTNGYSLAISATASVLIACGGILLFLGCGKS